MAQTQNETQVGLNAEQAGALAEKSWQKWIDPVLKFAGKLPDEIGSFFSDYRQPLTTLGLIVAALVTVKLTLAILSAINDIPLLAPIFEIVGLGYAVWFVWRYLWKSGTRQELAQEFNALKSQILGGGKSEE